jgi:hypothetical protein
MSTKYIVDEHKNAALSPYYKMLLARQDKLMKILREQPAAALPAPRSVQEIREIGQAAGIWTASGKLTPAYKK